MRQFFFAQLFVLEKDLVANLRAADVRLEKPVRVQHRVEALAERDASETALAVGRGLALPELLGHEVTLGELASMHLFEHGVFIARLGRLIIINRILHAYKLGLLLIH